MTPDFRASETDLMELPVGHTVTMESLRQAVVPPFVMIVPFVEPSGGIEVIRQTALGEDGVHGCVYTLRATQVGNASLRVGFRDLRTGEVVKERMIQVRVRGKVASTP